MANGTSQTGVDDTSGDIDITQDIKEIYDFANIDNQGNITDSPEQLSQDLAFIKTLQGMFPMYQGTNAYRMRHNLLTDDDLLDEVTTQIMNKKIQSDTRARQFFSDDENYINQYNSIKQTIRKRLASGSVTGKSISNTIIDRSLNLTSEPQVKGSPSFETNNPLNLTTSLDEKIKERLRENGIALSESEKTLEGGTLARFGSYEEGLEAAKITLKEKYGDSTVAEAISSWSGGKYNSDILPSNNKFSDKKVSELSPEQFDIMLSRMRDKEGWVNPENNPFSNSLPIEDYKEAIKENPEKYSKFNIVDEDGNIIGDEGKDQNSALEQLIFKNENLHRALVADRYKKFEGVIDNENNAIKKLISQPSLKAQAFAVYDQFGSEGLTNFINLMQHEFLGEEAVSDQQAKQALNWYRANDVGRVTKRFIGRGKNRIQFVPNKPTFDTKVPVPGDLSSATAPFYRFDKEEKSFKPRSRQDAAKHLFDTYVMREAPVTLKGGTRTEELFIKIMKEDGLELGEDTEQKAGELNRRWREESIENIKNMEESGWFHSSGYSYMLAQMMDKFKEEGKVAEIINPIKHHATYVGNNKWTINWNKAPYHIKILLDALNQDVAYGPLVSTPDPQGTVVMELNRMERVKETYNDFANKFFTDKQRYNKKRGEWETVPEKGIDEWIQNNLVNVALGTNQAIQYWFMEPFLRRSSDAWEWLGEQTGLETAQDIARWFDYKAESDIVEGLNNLSLGGNFGFGIGAGKESDLDVIRNSDPVTRNFQKLMPFGQYLLSIYLSTTGTLAAGGLAAKGGKHLLNRLGKTSMATSSAMMGKFAKGSKAEAVFARWQQKLASGHESATAGSFILGDLVLESAQLKDRTLLATVGFPAFDAALEKFNKGNPNLSAKYKATSGINRLASDAAASLVFSALFDVGIGAARFGKDLTRKGLAKVGVRSEALEKVPQLVEGPEGRVVFENTPVRWRPDTKIFTHNILKDLDEWAVGEFRDTMSRAILGSLKERGNVSDFMTNVVSNINETLDDDVLKMFKDSVKHYNEILNGGTLSEGQINDIAKESYEQFTTQVADGIYSMTQAPSGVNRNSIPLKLAEAMENASLTLKTLKDENGASRLNLEEANRLAGDNPNRIVKQLDEDGVYGVVEVKPNYWLTDVATKIRQKGLDTNISDSIEKQLEIENLKGIPEEELTDLQLERIEEIHEVWNSIYGQRVRKGNTNGYVIGLGKERGFKVVTESGEVIDNVGLKAADETDELVESYIKEESQDTRGKFELFIDDVKDSRRALEAIEQAKGKIKNSSIKQYRKKLKNQIDFYKEAESTRRSEPSGKPLIFNDEFRNEWGFGRKIVDFFAKQRDTNRPTKKMVERIARSIGLDDERIRNLVRITRGGNEKRIIGKKNVGPIREWNPSEGPVPKDVIVKKRSANGRELYFLSNKKTELEPSMFVDVDGTLRKNPDWDAVNVNSTFKEGEPKTYVAHEFGDGDVWYREAKKGESGSFLNIQNPKSVKLSDFSDSYITNKKVLHTGVDGYKTSVNGVEYWKPINEGDQTFRPSEVIGEPEQRVAVVTKNERITPQEPEVVEFTRGTALEGVEKAGKDEIIILKDQSGDYYVLNKGITEDDPAWKVSIFDENKNPIEEQGFDTFEEAKRQIRGKVALAKELGEKFNLTLRKRLPSEEEAEVIIRQAGMIPDQVWKGAGRFILGNYATALFTDDENKQFAGAILFALAYPKMRTRVRNVFRTGTEKGFDALESAFRKVEEETKQWYEDVEVRQFWADKYDVHNPKHVEWKQKVARKLSNAAAAGADISEAIKSNGVVQSSFSFIQNFSSIRQGRKLLDMLLDVQHTPNEMLTKLTLKYDKAVGRPGAFNDLPDDLLNTARTILRSLEPERGTPPDDKIAKLINDSVARIMDSEARIENGQFTFNQNKQVVLQYENRPKLREFDEQLVRSEEVGEIFPVLRDWFEDYKKEWLGHVDTKMDETYRLIHNRFKPLADRMLEADNISSFKELLEGDDAILFKQAKKEDVDFVKLIDLKNIKDSFTDLGRGYYPMMFSREKMEVSLSKFIDNYMREHPSANKAKARSEFFAHIKEKFWNLNKDKGGNLQFLKKYSQEDRNIVDHTFDTKSKARGFLEGTIKTPDLGFSAQEKEQLLGAIDRYIGERTKLKNAGTPNEEQVTEYFIREPEDFIEEFGLVEKANRIAYGSMFDVLHNGFVIKNSNHLEKPRKYVLPEEIRETNLNRVVRKYTQDVGNRLHFVREGVFDKNDFKEKFTAPIRDHLIQKLGKGKEERIQNHITRVENIYKQQAGIARELRSFDNPERAAAYYRRKTRTAKAAESIRNFIGGGYLYGIAFYDWFQHAIMTPLLTSQGSWRESAMTMFGSKQATDRMNDVAKTFHYADQRARAFLPEITEGLDLRNAQTWGWLDSTHDFSKQWRDFAGDFSFIKTIGKTSFGNKVLGGGIDNWGSYAMFAGGFYDVNRIATNINVFAHLLEAQELAGIYRRLQAIPEGQPRVVSDKVLGIASKKYTMGDVVDGFSRLGVHADEIDKFVNNMSRVDDLIDHVRGKGRDFKITDLEGEGDAFKQIQNIVETAVDNYHGRNKMLRPEAWNTSLGRLAAQYSFYHQNFAVQTTQRRIRQPIVKWNQKYGKLMEDDTPIFKIFMELQQGDKGLEKLRRRFNTDDEALIDEAIENIPINAMYTVLKMFSAMGLTFAMDLSKDAFNDLSAIMIDQSARFATGEGIMKESEYWDRFDRNRFVNPWAPEKDRTTLGEIVEDPEKKNIMKGVGFLGTLFSDMGGAGRWGTLFFQDSRFDSKSIVEISPVGREAQDIWNGFLKPIGHTLNTGNLQEAGRMMGSSVYDITARKMPVFGSMSLARNKVKSAIFNKPSRQGLKFLDTENDFIIEPEDLEIDTF